MYGCGQGIGCANTPAALEEIHRELSAAQVEWRGPVS